MSSYFSIWISIIFYLFSAIVCSAGEDAKKKVFFLDSYHENYEWSVELQKGFMKVLKSRPDVSVKFHWMDTKRNPSEEACKSAALKAKKDIESFKPDVLVAADDNASKYLVQPYFSKSLPVIFLGINSDISEYGYPNEHSTGIKEVFLGRKIFEYLSKYSKGKRIGFLSGKTLTSKALCSQYNKEFFDGKMKCYLVSTFDEYKESFKKAQAEVDMMIINNKAGISDWSDKEAEEFIVKNTTIPTGTRLSWMAKYALISVVKDPEWIGVKAAQMSLEILEGTPPSQMPLLKNDKIILTANLKIAKKMGIVFPLSILKTAKIIR
jgi:ABC-type uncharacterized transport system substrate-binding protein